MALNVSLNVHGRTTWMVKEVRSEGAGVEGTGIGQVEVTSVQKPYRPFWKQVQSELLISNTKANILELKNSSEERAVQLKQKDRKFGG